MEAEVQCNGISRFTERQRVGVLHTLAILQHMFSQPLEVMLVRHEKEVGLISWSL